MGDNTVLVTHGEDVDGIVSAAILDKNLDGAARQGERDYFFVKHNESAETLSYLGEYQERSSNSDLFILDLAAKDDLNRTDKNGSSLAKRLTSRFDSVTWIDHHGETFKNQNTLLSQGIKTIIEESKLCTAMLVYKEYAHPDPTAYYLARTAQANDYPEEGTDIVVNGFSIKLQELITAFHFFYQDPADKLSVLIRDLKYIPFVFSGGPNSHVYEEELRNFKDIKERYLKELIQGLRIVRLNTEKGEVKLLTGHTSGALPAKMTVREIFDKYRGLGLDGVMIHFGKPTNNMLVFSYPDGSVDVPAFCRFMGGGGREGAGGFSFQVNKKNFKKRLEHVLEEIKKF